MLTFNPNRAGDALPRECLGAESMLGLGAPASTHIASLHHHQHLSFAAFLGHAHFPPPPPPPSWFLSPPSSSSSPAPSDGPGPGWKSPPPEDEEAPSTQVDPELHLMNGGQQGPRPGQVGHNPPPAAELCNPCNGGEGLHWLADVASHHRAPGSDLTVGTPVSSQDLYPLRPRMYAPPPMYVGLPPFYATPSPPTPASYSAFYSPATMLHPPRGSAFMGIGPAHSMGRGLFVSPPSSNQAPVSFPEDTSHSSVLRRFPPPSAPPQPSHLPSPPAPPPTFNAPPPQTQSPPTRGGPMDGKEGSLKHRFLSSRTSSGKSALEDIKEEERVVAPPRRRRRGEVKTLPGSHTRLLYPAHFTRGSVIQLATGELKRVEDMRTDDFVASADASNHLKIDSSTVVRVDWRSVTDDEDDDAGSGGGRQVALLGFSVGERRVQVTVEAAIEHPFFVFGQGWSSCCPERTKSRYGLTCSKLQVGDVCVSLTHKTRPPTEGNAQVLTPPPMCSSSSCDVPTDMASRKRRWSAPEVEPEPETPPIAPPPRSSS